jgi:hypothetical protein
LAFKAQRYNNHDGRRQEYNRIASNYKSRLHLSS